MDAEGPAVAARSSDPAAAATADAVAIKTEDKDGGMDVQAKAEDESNDVPAELDAEQQPASKLRQQAVGMDLGDPSAQQLDTNAGDKDLQQSEQQQQQLKKILTGRDTSKPMTAADVQVALFTAAAAGAAAGAAATAPQGAPGASSGPTAVSPYVQGSSAAAAAAAAMANAGLNLADSPHVRGAVEQDTPHPGALMPDAAAAAVTSTDVAGHSAGAEHEVRAVCCPRQG
jgi:hypothetical protein